MLLSNKRYYLLNRISTQPPVISVTNKIFLIFRKRKTFSFGSSGDKNCSDELSVEIDETQDDDDQLSSPSPKQIDDLKTALHNRDSLIKRYRKFIYFK